MVGNPSQEVRRQKAPLLASTNTSSIFRKHFFSPSSSNIVSCWVIFVTEPCYLESFIASKARGISEQHMDHNSVSSLPDFSSSWGWGGGNPFSFQLKINK